MSHSTWLPSVRTIQARAHITSLAATARTLGVSRGALMSFLSGTGRQANAAQIEQRARELGWLDGPGAKATTESRAEAERMVSRYFGRVR